MNEQQGQRFISLVLAGGNARGRNGWFEPRILDVEVFEGRVCLWGFSRKAAYTPPLHLALSKAEAEALIGALREVCAWFEANAAQGVGDGA